MTNVDATPSPNATTSTTGTTSTDTFPGLSPKFYPSAWQVYILEDSISSILAEGVV